MSKVSDGVKSSDKIVVFFDICSSTKILEHLVLADRQLSWRNLLIRLKDYLAEESTQIPFAVYKFLGDGWILLFDSAAITGEDLLGLLSRLCAKYQKFFEIRIEKILSSKIQTGLTFGIESGPLVEIRMNESDEYFGRALNVAARLQGAARTLDSPQGKLLLSRNAFDKLRLLGLKKTFPATSVRVDLRNLFDGDSYSAKVIVLHK